MGKCGERDSASAEFFVLGGVLLSRIYSLKSHAAYFRAKIHIKLIQHEALYDVKFAKTISCFRFHRPHFYSASL
jgi:hypothetical protein